MSKRFQTFKLGEGHGGNASNLPVIRETLLENMEPRQRALLAQLEPGTRVYRMGKVKIFVSPPTAYAGWHVSISHPDRYPTWDEVAAAWYGLVPDADRRTGAMLLPPKAEYINIHNFCFQVLEQESQS